MIDAELLYLIHFFNDQKSLFKTITMVQEKDAIEEISDVISSNKGWYSHRYGKNDRQDYIKRRRFVEKELYTDYVNEYGSLKEIVPVYFYLYPNISKARALEMAQKRIKNDEAAPSVIFIKLLEIKDFTNITFTLNDSFASYWKKAIESGIKCRDEENGREVLPDHNKIFPFLKIEQIHRKYREKNPYYEVQIWDYKILEETAYEIW